MADSPNDVPVRSNPLSPKGSANGGMPVNFITNRKLTIMEQKLLKLS